MLHLRNWEFGVERTWDDFHLVPTKAANKFKTSLNSGDVHATTPPCPEDASNEWQNSALDEVESFVLTIDNDYESDGRTVNTSIYILLDSKGLEDETCIVGERRFDDETGEHVNAFNKVRVPWDDVHIMWANLEIANVGFEEYCDQIQGCDEEFWWRWVELKKGSVLGLDDERQEMKDEAFRKLEEEGKA